MHILPSALEVHTDVGPLSCSGASWCRNTILWQFLVIYSPVHLLARCIFSQFQSKSKKMLVIDLIQERMFSAYISTGPLWGPLQFTWNMSWRCYFTGFLAFPPCPKSVVISSAPSIEKLLTSPWFLVVIPHRMEGFTFPFIHGKGTQFRLVFVRLIK